MGWAVGYDGNWNRHIGYGVPATCDHPGCGVEIDRGLSFVCGGDAYGGEHGYGLFFCRTLMVYAGDRRDNAQLCARSYAGRGKKFTATPDTAEWVEHKATHPSWAESREEQQKEVPHGG